MVRQKMSLTMPGLMSTMKLLLVTTALLSCRLSSGSEDKDVVNPYYSGCLREKVDGWNKKRVCSSRFDPPNAAELGICEDPHFDYMEIRIGTGNWDSASALGWIVQIILSEVLGVPSSIESGAFDSFRDFYDPQGRIGKYAFIQF